jgi:hypothetical protein
MVAITPAQEEAITRKISAAYGLKAATIKQLAQTIYITRIAAIIGAYRDCCHALHIQLAPDWTPPKALAERMAREAQEVAQGVAETYHALLLSQVGQFLERQRNTEAQQRAQDTNDQTDDHTQTMTLLLLALIAFLADWFSGFLPWKVEQIATNETMLGANLGTRQFFDDLSNNSIQVGDDIDLGGVYIAVIPEASSADACAEYAGNIYAWQDYNLLPPFPMHVNCIHQIKLVINGVLEDIP